MRSIICHGIGFIVLSLFIAMLVCNLFETPCSFWYIFGTILFLCSCDIYEEIKKLKKKEVKG
jgi:hypothetical protein